MIVHRHKRLVSEVHVDLGFEREDMAKLQESYEEEEVGIERHIQYNKRGELRMVGQKSLFDLDEPVWHADEKVRA